MGTENLAFESNERERIEAAAIRFQGEVYTGPMHLHIFSKLQKDFPNATNLSTSCEEGFTTTSGRFVDRREAGEIAERAEQIEGELPEDKRLDSENIDFTTPQSEQMDNRM